MKDIRGKVIALGVIGAIIGGIVSFVLNLIKLIGMVIGFALSLVGIPVNFVLGLIGLKVALACLVLCLIGAIAINRRANSSPLIKKIITLPIAICGIILIGHIAGFVLNFISSSPLIMGGMIGFIYPALFIVFLSVLSLRNPDKENGAFGEILKAFFIKLSIVTVIGTAVGVSLGAAVSAIFPNVMLGMWSIALASTVIGAIVFPIEIFTAELITLSAIKKLEAFTAFVVNKVTKCFSSKRNEPSKSWGEVLDDLTKNLPSSFSAVEESEPSQSLGEVLASLAGENGPSKSFGEILADIKDSPPSSPFAP